MIRAWPATASVERLHRRVIQSLNSRHRNSDAIADRIRLQNYSVACLAEGSFRECDFVMAYTPYSQTEVDCIHLTRRATLDFDTFGSHLNNGQYHSKPDIMPLSIVFLRNPGRCQRCKDINHRMLPILSHHVII